MKRNEKLNYKYRRSIIVVGAAAAVFLALSWGTYPHSFAAQHLQSENNLPPNDENKTTMSSITTTATTTADGTTGVANATAADMPNATFVEFVSNIEQIRGHLDQAVANKESGNDTLTQAHTLHPIGEVYSSIEVLLANQNSTLNQTLSEALKDLSSNVATTSVQQFENQTRAIDMILNQTVQAVIPTFELNNTAFNASVVARLLDIAGHEYEEAVANGMIKEIVEYQDAQAFIHRAEAIFNSTSDTIDEAMAHEVQEVNEFFAVLNSTVDSKGDPQTVETTINGIIHELEEITGFSSSQLLGGEEAGTTAEEQDPIAIINNIKSLLDKLLSAYQSQNYDEAESIAIEAYLENYEHIEAPIAEHDEQLMLQTETMLREELRQMIEDKAPVDQIQQHIANIEANLDKAASLLQQ
ncbi:hypothetical protein Ngar_c08350 [Candidatus Nitrososphaera gargensis Ga9.2]|uniref:Uncharacterized protein n=1 Tax=Nitrososphaera gargensis (strain Ga9.2) TaxID=1237085 RepID=K0IIC5_NITGG|nr:hypothetical protein Ngar_c08350 [Candidatus Nitrososphaera gargensis Ga9.2]